MDVKAVMYHTITLQNRYYVGTPPTSGVCANYNLCDAILRGICAFAKPVRMMGLVCRKDSQTLRANHGGAGVGEKDPAN